MELELSSAHVHLWAINIGRTQLWWLILEISARNMLRNVKTIVIKQFEPGILFAMKPFIIDLYFTIKLLKIIFGTFKCIEKRIFTNQLLDHLIWKCSHDESQVIFGFTIFVF